MKYREGCAPILISQGFHSEKLMGNIIPFDGIVISGDAMVNQASMTGESIPVRKGWKRICRNCCRRG
jgi:hypothetical protein